MLFAASAAFAALVVCLAQPPETTALVHDAPEFV
jgi:hypothetical protein